MSAFDLLSERLPDCAKHFDSVKWLLETDVYFRGTGRSTIMALAFLDIADCNEGTVKVFDHFLDMKASKRMVEIISHELQVLSARFPDDWGKKKFELNYNLGTVKRVR